MRARGEKEGLGEGLLCEPGSLGPQDCGTGVFSLVCLLFYSHCAVQLVPGCSFPGPSAVRRAPSPPASALSPYLVSFHWPTPHPSTSFDPQEFPASALCVLMLPNTRTRVHACSHVLSSPSCAPVCALSSPPSGALVATAPFVCRAEAFPTGAHLCLPVRSPCVRSWYLGTLTFAP